MLDPQTFGSEGGDRPKAVMVGVQLPGVTAAELESSMDELARLAKTLGLEVIGRVTQRRSRVTSANVLGEGKLRDLARWTDGPGEVPRYQKPGTRPTNEGDEHDDELAEDSDDYPLESHLGDGDLDDPTDAMGDFGTEEVDSSDMASPRHGDSDGEPQELATVVLVDHDLSPRQQRNLEIAAGAEVHDRTSVIIGIFHRHARTREARLQVEIARLRYVAPRLREGGGGGDRVRGGIGGKGAGESSLELDRRRNRDRIAELRQELQSIERTSSVRRGRRQELPVVALVGYTNAGKSSLMRALTGSEVYVANKLFATLDTTVRTLEPRTEPPILVSDTVGFIKKLPHDLVSSFRSTLQEAVDADLIIHLVDGADPDYAGHMVVTREVLSEVGADLSTSWTVLNKMDKVDESTRAGLLAHNEGAAAISVKSPEDVAALRDRILAFFLGDLEDAEVLVPWALHGTIAHLIRETCRVLAEAHEEEGARFQIRAAASIVQRVRSRLADAESDKPQQ